MVGAGDLSGLARRVAEDISPMGADVGDAGQLPLRIGQEHGFLQAKLQKGKRMDLLRQGNFGAVSCKLPGFGKNALDQLIKYLLRTVKRRWQRLCLRNVRMNEEGLQLSFFLDVLLNYSF